MSTPARSAADLRVLADAAEDGEGASARAALASGARAASIWVASSRVGARISARGLRGWRGLPAGREAGHQRQQEGVGLAGAGAAAAEHVAPGEGVGQRRGLDREGGGDAVGIEDGGQRGGHAEAGESRVSRHRWLLQKVTGSFCPAQTQHCVSGA